MRGSPSWTFGGRQQAGSLEYDSVKAAVPPPNSYSATDPSVFKTTRSASCRMGARTKVVDYSSIKDNPGPGAYDVRGEFMTSEVLLNVNLIY